MNRDGTPANTAVDGGEEVARALSGLVETVEVGPVPYDAVRAGGRRRVVRRRTALTGALALAVVAAVGGVAAVNGGPARPGTEATVTTVAAAAAPGPATGPAAVSAAPSAGPRDPFTPVRAQVASGTKDGKPWTVWAALWPAPGKEKVHEQARRIWEEDAAAGSTDAAPTTEFVDRYVSTDTDRVVFYFVRDGKRMTRSMQGDLPVPGTPLDLEYKDYSKYNDFPNMYIGPSAKTGESDPLYGAPWVVLGKISPDVARAEVKWADGTTLEPPIVSLGDSEVRWIGVARRGVTAELRLYKADGSLLASERTWIDG
ncbi:hypothetical protein [Kitasatospora sp. NPDC093806]|uniref:hypothetical protein n=1 Tax=Kitasatospora sp. NPDC093806 TaxID=3155075 RepID=UPI00342E6F89